MVKESSRVGKQASRKQAFSQDEQRWMDVVERDRSKNGSFVYAVVSTGVYCLPSCPSRRPLRKNVLFFEKGFEAEKAGFRPCLRCRPLQENEQEQKVKALCHWIEQCDVAPKLEELAEHVGWSPSHTHRVFKALMGMTPWAYVSALRAKRMRSALHTSTSVTEAIYEAGYSSSSRFYEVSEKVVGMKPSLYRAGGENIEMHIAVQACSLGFVLVAASERGLCSILLGDSAEALFLDFTKRFPKARHIQAEHPFEELLGQVIDVIEGRDTGRELPLDVRGTLFQQRVWEALRHIPVGETRTYEELAQMLDAPKATRAVARACASNPVAIAVPCHRVIRKDGGLGGYRWGLSRKQALLERELREVGK